MTQEGIHNGRLRFGVLGGGCAGFTYDMSFDEKTEATQGGYSGQDVKYAFANDFVDKNKDVLFREFEVTYIVDKKTLALIRGTTVDYVETLQSSGFKFNNPRATATCGCEKSFT
jgi:iron-sulfur cluster assembly protein